MYKLKILLIGTYEQSDYEKWKHADIAGHFNPYEDNHKLNLDIEFDAAVVVIPNYKKLIAEPICEVLRTTDKPVCVLKMRLNSYDDLEPLRKLTDEQRNRLYIGEQYQYICGKLENVGKIESIAWRAVLEYRHADWMDAYNHMIFEDLSYHHFTDLIIWLGELHGSIYADSFAPSWMSDKGFASAIIKTDTGIHITYDVRWGAAKSETDFFGDLTIQGDKDCIRINGNHNKTQQYQGWAGVIDHFCDIVKCEQTDGIMLTFDRFDNAAKLMYSAVESAEKNQVIYF